MEKIKGAVECWQSDEAAELYISPIGAGDLVDVFNYVGPFHAVCVITESDLEAYIREEIKKAFEAGQKSAGVNFQEDLVFSTTLDDYIKSLEGEK